jgi:hypothetical protein
MKASAGKGSVAPTKELWSTGWEPYSSWLFSVRLLGGGSDTQQDPRKLRRPISSHLPGLEDLLQQRWKRSTKPFD